MIPRWMLDYQRKLEKEQQMQADSHDGLSSIEPLERAGVQRVS